MTVLFTGRHVVRRATPAGACFMTSVAVLYPKQNLSSAHSRVEGAAPARKRQGSVSALFGPVVALWVRCRGLWQHADVAPAGPSLGADCPAPVEGSWTLGFTVFFSRLRSPHGHPATESPLAPVT